MKIDMHNHTTASFDALTTPKQLYEASKEKGIDFLALTNHNNMDDIQEVEAIFNHAGIIRGEEIKTKDGEVIALFLFSPIKEGLSFKETLNEIRAQGAIAYAPHPFDIYRYGLAREEFLKEVDIIEVYNSKSTAAIDQKAWDFAETYGMLKGAGSDSHTPQEVGRAYVEVSGPIRGPEELLIRLKNGKPVLKKRTSLFEKIVRHAHKNLSKLLNKK